MDDTRETVLIMDDDFHFVSRISDGLKHEGLNVLTACDGNEGIALAELKRPDLIVMELLMPKRSGFLVLERLRQTDLTCPIVVVTKNDGERHRAYADILGVDDFLLKPATTVEVVASVTEILGLSYSQDQEEHLDDEVLHPSINIA